MKTKLSHSQCQRYQLCGQAYKYHYQEKIRPSVFSAALAFGTALDDSLNILLTQPDKSAEDMFKDVFKTQKINNVSTFLPTSVHLVYAEADYDEELLTEEDIKEITGKIIELELNVPQASLFDVYQELRKKKKDKGFINLDNDEKVFYNLMNWYSLKNKGLLMLKAYRKKVLPKIEKVRAVQKYVALQNNEGDSIIGYVDLVADIKDVGTVILDNKTSSMEYEENAVLTSPQLSLYTHILEQEYNTRKAGYIVLRKSVIKNRKKVCTKCKHDGSGSRAKTCDNTINGKRCGGEWNETIDPDIHIQFLVDEIPSKTEEIVINNFDEVNNAIKAGIFTRNFNSCHNTYGGPCPYLGLCFKDNMNGLVDLKKEEK